MPPLFSPPHHRATLHADQPAQRLAQHRRPAARGRWAAVLSAVALLMLGACQAQSASPVAAAGPAAAAPSAAKPAAAIAALQARISQEIGAARCERDGQCRTLAVGARPCGGPEAWLAYSASTGDAARLAAWAAEWTTLRQAQNTQDKLMSACQVLPDPGARCVQQRCALQAVPALQ
jgi:hypothetical protein